MRTWSRCSALLILIAAVASLLLAPVSTSARPRQTVFTAPGATGAPPISPAPSTADAGRPPVSPPGAHAWATPLEPQYTNGDMLFTRTGSPSQLAAMRLDGTGMSPISPAGVSESSPSWYPDGSRYVFVRRVDGQVDIFARNADGTGEVRLTSTPDYHETGPDPSPHGVVFTRIPVENGGCNSGDIGFVANDGTGYRNLTTSERWECTPRWSPDGTKLVHACWYGGTWFSSDWGDLCATSISFEHAVPQLGSTQRLTETNEGGWTPEWRPDGAEITYHDVYGTIFAYRFDPATGIDEGSSVELVPSDAASWYMFSKYTPDGAKIVYNAV